MKNVLLTSVLGATLLATGMSAQEIRKREENQQKRIAEGVASGQLTPKEAERIEKKEARLNKEVRRDRRSGGKLTRKERRKIARQQDKLSRDIYKQKHDRQTVPK